MSRESNNRIMGETELQLARDNGLWCSTAAPQARFVKQGLIASFLHPQTHTHPRPAPPRDPLAFYCFANM